MSQDEHTSILITREDRDSFREWFSNLYLILRRHNLQDFILEEQVKKIPVSKIDKNELNHYLKLPTLEHVVYDKSVDKGLLDRDNAAKNYIFNSMGRDFRKTTDAINSTAFEMFSVIKKSLRVSDEEMIKSLENELDNLTFNEKENSMSMFISNLNRIYDELESLKKPKTDEEKFKLLYVILDNYNREIIYYSKMLDYKDDWNKTCNEVIKAHIELEELYKDKRYRKKAQINNIQRKRNRPKCSICHRYGHKAEYCKFNKNKKNSRNNNNRKNNKNDNNNNKNQEKSTGQSNFMATEEEQEDDDYLKYINFAINTPKTI